MPSLCVSKTYEVITEELYENESWLFGLDIGVASAVIALSAARCVPFSSCNGGAYGGSHHEFHLVVAFYARPEYVQLLLRCAEEANVGMENGPDGAIVLYADDTDKIHAFAAALTNQRQHSNPSIRQERNGVHPFVEENSNCAYP